MFRNTESKFRKGRLIVLVAFICLFWIALEVNLFRLQIIKHEEFSKAAENQYSKNIELPARRGSIYDRNERVMATNVIHVDLAVDPRMVQNKSILAKKCAEAFGKTSQHYLKKMNYDKSFVYLERRVPESNIREILSLKDNGLIKGKNFRRSYPYKTYASQLLGFTDPDDRGLSGIELQYEDTLRGENGEAVLQYDGPRRISYNPDQPLRWPKDGANIYLTIDKNIQTIVEQELSKGIKAVKGKAGMAVVMNPNNGEILALTNYPSFDPNRHNKYKTGYKRNRAIADILEPGSTLKIFSVAALLQEQRKKRDDIVFCENGRYKLGRYTFTDTKKYGWLPLVGVIEKSSNIGVIKLVEDLPESVLFKYLVNFGFGSETGIGLSGEESGYLDPPERWSGISKYSISIGYEISVTAIQLTAAYASVINGGYLYRPYVIDHFKDHTGRVFDVTQPEMVRQIISKEVSDELKDFMLRAVVQGTGKKARVDGLKIGGKTGTARKFDKKAKQYSTKDYYASFVGFAPFDKPKYLCTIIVDEPRGLYYGGDVAAPIFKKVMQRMINLNQDDVNLDHKEKRESPRMAEIKALPNLQGFQLENAISLLKTKGIKYKISGVGATVSKITVKNDKVHLERGRNQVEMKKMPKLVGLALREATSRIDLAKINLKIQGNGIVKKQSISPGTPIERRTELVLTCN